MAGVTAGMCSTSSWYPRSQLPMANPLRTFATSVLADFGSTQRYRQKYFGEKVSLKRLPVDAVRKVGFQMLVATRTMRLLRDLKLPVLPMVASRLIRHLYGAEIHWNAEVADGVSIVHGNGLVLSHGAVVGPHCILFQGVTLGESIDPSSREVGAPRLEAGVHVGPGAVLIGPIVVGEGSKVMANAVVDRTVPPRSIVRTATIEVERRPDRPDAEAVAVAHDG